MGIPVAVAVSDDARRAGVQQAFALGWHVAELRYRSGVGRLAARVSVRTRHLPSRGQPTKTLWRRARATQGSLPRTGTTSPGHQESRVTG
jgi:hypothetical protein